MPLTIHAPPSAPMSKRMMMAELTPPTLSLMARSKSFHEIRREAMPMQTQKAVATSKASCDAPANVSSPKMLTTQAMSATSIASGTHDSHRGGSRFTLSYYLLTFHLLYATLLSFLIIEKMNKAARRQMPIKVPQTM